MGKFLSTRSAARFRGLIRALRRDERGISLVLAQESIARASADRPPAERFDTALKEVLWMRAGGMGWGRIAFITAGRNRTGAGIPRKGGS